MRATASSRARGGSSAPLHPTTRNSTPSSSNVTSRSVSPRGGDGKARHAAAGQATPIHIDKAGCEPPIKASRKLAYVDTTSVLCEKPNSAKSATIVLDTCAEAATLPAGNAQATDDDSSALHAEHRRASLRLLELQNQLAAMQRIEDETQETLDATERELEGVVLDLAMAKAELLSSA